jgi:hypothetical protein
MPSKKSSRKSSKSSKSSRKSSRIQTRRGGSPASNRVNSFYKTTGGSLASDRVMSFANSAGVQSNMNVVPKLAGNPANFNLYQTTGGGKKRKSKSKSKKSKSKSRKNRSSKMKRGGGASDIRDTLYSRAIDVRSDEAPFFNAFTSEEYLSPQQLINEPNMVANPPFATN